MERKLWTYGATRWVVLAGAATTVAVVGFRSSPPVGGEIAWLVGDGELLQDRWRGITGSGGSLYSVRETLRFRLHEPYENVFQRLNQLKELGWEVATSEQAESGRFGKHYAKRSTFYQDARHRGLKVTAPLPIGLQAEFGDGERVFMRDRKLPFGIPYAGARRVKPSSSMLAGVQEEEVVEVQIVAAEPVGRRGFRPSPQYTTVIVSRLRPPTVAEWLSSEAEHWWERTMGLSPSSEHQ